jgi:sarcosine oxidase subunit gamma
MPDQLPRLSPLSGLTCDSALPGRSDAGLVLEELAFFTHINLRGRANDAAFLAETQRHLGVPLPLRPNTISNAGELTAFWLGPDEWLITISPSSAKISIAVLRNGLRGRRCSLTDISDSQTILHLHGSRVLDVLRKGCSLDLRAPAFRAGFCAQTMIAKTGALIGCIDPPSSLYLIVRRSFAEYLALWLKDAATEYGFRML